MELDESEFLKIETKNDLIRINYLTLMEKYGEISGNSKEMKADRRA